MLILYTCMMLKEKMIELRTNNYEPSHGILSQFHNSGNLVLIYQTYLS